MTQRETVLHMLETAGDRGVTTAQFLEAHIPRAAARICELRDKGHVIDTQRLRKGSFLFKLVRQQASSSGVADGRGGSGVDFFENAGAASISTEDKGERVAPAQAVGAARLFEMDVPTGHHRSDVA